MRVRIRWAAVLVLPFFFFSSWGFAQEGSSPVWEEHSLQPTQALVEKALGSNAVETVAAVADLTHSREALAGGREVLLSSGVFQSASILLVSALFFLLLSAARRSKRDPLFFQFTSRAARKLIQRFNLLFLLLVVVIAGWALTSIEATLKRDTRESLQTLLDTAQGALIVWGEDHQQALVETASDPRVVALSSAQLELYKQGGNLRASQSLQELREIFKDLQQRSGHIGFFVIAPDGTSLASMREENIDQLNLIRQHRPELLRRVFAGESLLIPPIPSDVALLGAENIAGVDRPPTMFFAAPIRDVHDKVIAVLTERIDPHREFSRVLRLARIGASGETYAFDRDGRLLSASNFRAHLEASGALGLGEQSILSVAIRDPSAEQRSRILPSPLTKMARSAIRGESGFDMDAYPDYRGVPVVGVWTWIDGLGIGLASELDAKEALHAYSTARLAIILVFIVIVLMSLGSSLLLLRLGARAERALHKAKLSRPRSLEQGKNGPSQSARGASRRPKSDADEPRLKPADARSSGLGSAAFIPPALPGLDVAAGTKAWLDMEHYVLNLQYFSSKYGGAGVDIREALEDGDLQRAKRITQDLIRSADNMAVSEVAALARQVDGELKNNKEAVSLELLIGALEQALYSIENLKQQAANVSLGL